jgi:beta-lactamase regulating signal transducer with metallopeptidase domain
METYVNALIRLADAALSHAVNALWLGLVITALGWLVLRYSRRLNAATRYVVWWSVFVLVVTLPFGVGMLPRLSVDRWLDDDAPKSTTTAVSPVAPDNVFAGVPTERFVPAGSGVRREGTSRVNTDQRSIRLNPPVPTDLARGDIAAGLRANARPSLGAVIKGMLPMYVLIFLIVGGWVMFLRLGISYFLLRRIRSSCVPCDAGLDTLFADVIGQVGVKRRVQIRCSGLVRMPMAAGFLKPMVIVPDGLVRELTESELRAVLLHELAHLRRWDDWSKLAQKLLEALFFFNPVLWWVGQRLDFEREVSCDGWVVAHTGQLKGYARCLTRLVQLSASTPRLALAPSAMITKKQIFRRFERLLSGQESRDCRFSRTRFVATAACLVAAVGLGVAISPAIAVPRSGLTYSQLSNAVAHYVGNDQPKSAAAAPSDRAETSSGDEKTPDTTLGDASEPTDSAQIDSASTRPAAAMSKKRSSSRSGRTSQTTRYTRSVVTTVTAPPAVAVPPSSPARAVSPAAPTPAMVTSIPAAPTAPVGYGGNGISWADDLLSALDLRDDSHGSTIISRGDGEQTFIWSDDDNELRITIDGEVSFADDDRSIKSISEGGSVDIRETHRGTKKRLEIEGGPNNELSYVYRVNGKKQAFDDSAKEWYAGVLLKLVRNSGIGVETRVKRILSKDGVDGVLDEINSLEGDWVKRCYFEELIKAAGLNREQYARVIQMATRTLDSDYEKAELLIGVADNSRSDEGLLPAYVDAVGTIESDYEVRRVLSAFDMGKRLDKAVAVAVLKIAGRMDSDYEKAELLIDMGIIKTSDPEIRAAYVNAIRDLDSDYETRRVLTSVATDDPADSALVSDLLEIAMDMDSDYEKAELLTQLAEQSGDNPALHRLYVDAAADIGSDYEMRRALSALSGGRNADDRSVSAVLGRAQRMESDYEKAELLISLIDQVESSPQLQGDYLDAAGSIDSDYDLARTLLALINEVELGDDVADKLLTVATRMLSDYEKNQVLSAMIPRCRGNERLEDALAQAIDGLSSEYERDQLYAKLYKQKRKSGQGSY